MTGIQGPCIGMVDTPVSCSLQSAALGILQTAAEREPSSSRPVGHRWIMPFGFLP
jgi:hypothetical protein